MVVLLTRVCEVLHARRAQGLESILVASMCRYRTIILGGASRPAIERGGGGRVSEWVCGKMLAVFAIGNRVQALEKRDYEIQTSPHNATCIPRFSVFASPFAGASIFFSRSAVPSGLSFRALRLLSLHCH